MEFKKMMEYLGHGLVFGIGFLHFHGCQLSTPVYSRLACACGER